MGGVLSRLRSSLPSEKYPKHAQMFLSQSTYLFLFNNIQSSTRASITVILIVLVLVINRMLSEVHSLNSRVHSKIRTLFEC